MSLIIANLIAAVVEGECELVRKLVNKGNANYCDSQAVSLLSRSISIGHYDVAMVLMEKGNAYVSARDNKGFTALHRACWHVAGYGHTTGEISSHVNSLKDIERVTEYAAHTAERKNIVNIITPRDELTNSFPHSNGAINTQRSTQSQKTNSREKFANFVPIDELEEGKATSTSLAVDPIVSFGEIAKELAQKHSCLDVIRMLVKQGADVNEVNHTTEVPDSLLERGSLRTPLILASIRGVQPVVALLVELGALIDFRDSYNMSALDYAAFYGQLKVVEYLTSIGGDSTRARKWAAAGFNRATTVSERVSCEVINALLCKNIARQSLTF